MIFITAPQRKTKQHSATKEYVKWVKDNYPNEDLQYHISPFIPPDIQEDKTLDMLARYLLYTQSSYNVILNGGTGTGKTTLIEYVAEKKNLPMHFVPPVKELRYSDVVGGLMETYEGQVIFAPGPVTRFLVYDKGYLGFDEMANLSHRSAIAMHGLLQYKPIEIETHKGLVKLAPKPGNHSIIGTGNFGYQKPQFNRATLQRCSFIDVPPLPDELFGNDLTGEKSTGKSFRSYMELLKATYPWKGQDTNHPLDVDWRWLEFADKPKETQEALVNLSKELRYGLHNFADYDEGGIDVSNATFKRIISLYSPLISPRSFNDIVLENLINPIAVEYPRHEEEKEKLTKMVMSNVQKYEPILFPKAAGKDDTA